MRPLGQSRISSWLEDGWREQSKEIGMGFVLWSREGRLWSPQWWEGAHVISHSVAKWQTFLSACLEGEQKVKREVWLKAVGSQTSKNDVIFFVLFLGPSHSRWTTVYSLLSIHPDIFYVQIKIFLQDIYIFICPLIIHPSITLLMKNGITLHTYCYEFASPLNNESWQDICGQPTSFSWWLPGILWPVMVVI